MKLSHIFDVFSKRDEAADILINKVNPTLRNKIILLCCDTFSNNRNGFSNQNYTINFWEEIHQALQYRHGKVQLTEGDYSISKPEDTINFLLTCKDEEFLDFVEYIFKVKCLFHVHIHENVLVGEINEIFTSESAGYELTEIVKEEIVEPANRYPLFGKEVTTIKVVSYPQIIKKDDQVIHRNILKPALKLLTDKKFKSANEEYLEALEDYKKKDYGDCLTKCCSAFESVMKIICDEKGWQYKQRDTASILLKIIIDKTNLDSFFETPLLIIATLRNRLSKSHGSGVKSKVVSQNLARYALNATASAIILLVEETK